MFDCPSIHAATTSVTTNLAALTNKHNHYRHDNYKTGRIETNRILVKAIQSAQVRPKAFIATSGAGYYPPSETFEYDENWTQPDRLQVPATGDTGAGKYLMELARDWEKASELDESRAPEVRRVIIRAGVVIGRDGGMIANLKIPFSLGLGGPIGRLLSISRLSINDHLAVKLACMMVVIVVQVINFVDFQVLKPESS